ncbi:MAG: nucleotidyl transferase AbiEii/AbiGii toxin family protein [archaeon]
MISKEKLKEYAKYKNYNLGQAEKDYFQELILFILYQEFGKELVFKGGTALTKCYGFDRFSEDLDFTASKEGNFEEIVSRGLKRYYLDFNVESDKGVDSLKVVYRIRGPLYINQPNSACKIILDISVREKVLLEVDVRKIGLQIEEIPVFDVIVMCEREIFAEKVRAIITRNKARDLYDLFYLIKKGVKIDIGLVNRKLDYYSMKFNLTNFRKSVNSKEVIWDKELKYLVDSYPDFNVVKKEVFGLLS